MTFRPRLVCPIRVALLVLLLSSGTAAATTFTVDSTADNTTADGFVTLREAVEAANTNVAVGDAPAGMADGDVIVFDAAIADQTLILTLGQLEITDDLTISGDPVSVNVSGGGTSRVFDITGGPVTLDAIVVRDGLADNGGCIRVAAGQSLTMDIRVSDCVATQSGGGVWSAGSVEDGSSFLSGNEARGLAATDGGGGFYNAGGTLVGTGMRFQGNSASMGSGSGGGLFNDGGTVTLTEGFFTENASQRAGGGIEAEGGTTTLNGTDLTLNTTGPNPGNGGGLHLSGAGLVTIDGADNNVLVSDNVAASEGGGLWNSSEGTMIVRNDVDIRENFANGTAEDNGGGGIFNDGGSLEVEGVFFFGNEAFEGMASGGGIFNNTGGTAEIVRSGFTANLARGGGAGVEHNSAAVTNVTSCGFSRNVAQPLPGQGAGLRLRGTGTVAIESTSFVQNTAGVSGGAIWVSASGILTLHDSRLGRNNANGREANEGGGGVYNDGGRVTVTETTFLINNAVLNGSGGGAFNNGGVLDIERSAFRRNRADRFGAGIKVDGGTVTITRTVIENNESGLLGSGFDPGDGGGLHISGGGTVTLHRSEVLNNEAFGRGGGVWNGGSLSVTDSEVSGNASRFGGGGIYQDGDVALLSLDGVTVASNSTETSGGGVYLLGGFGTLHNSTVHGNTAGSQAAGILVLAGNLDLDFVTLTGNSAAAAAGGILAERGTTANLCNTIVADNSAASSPDVAGFIVSTGYNLIEDPDGVTFDGVGDITGVDPLLGPLQDNGGRTPTRLPLSGSPVIDAGNSALDGTIADQRNFPRPVDIEGEPDAADGADIGAVEAQVGEVVAGASGAAPIPTLSEWMLLLLGLSLLTVGIRFLRA